MVREAGPSGGRIAKARVEQLAAAEAMATWREENVGDMAGIAGLVNIQKASENHHF